MNPSLTTNLAEATGTGLPRPKIIGAISGKGGIGKSNLMANLAVAAARRGRRVLLVDGDLGLANLDLLLGIIPKRSIADLLDHGDALTEVLAPGPRGISLVPAASGRSDLAALAPAQLAHIAKTLEEHANRFDIVLIDIGAGIGSTALGLAALCEPLLLLTNSEPTSLSDAYATLKSLRGQSRSQRIELVLNGVKNHTDALRTHGQLARMAERFLDTTLPFAEAIPYDPRLADAVTAQRPIVEAYPSAPAARAIASLAMQLLRHSPPQPQAPIRGESRHGAFD